MDLFKFISQQDFCTDIRIFSVNVEKNIRIIEVLFTP